MHRLHRRSRGFSLIEVLAALVIFGISIVALMENFGASTAMQSDLISRQQALALAGNKLEAIRAGNSLTESSDSGDFTGADAQFSWSTQIEKTDVADLMKVTVTVRWNSGTSQREATLTTLMTERSKPDELAS